MNDGGLTQSLQGLDAARRVAWAKYYSIREERERERFIASTRAALVDWLGMVHYSGLSSEARGLAVLVFLEEERYIRNRELGIGRDPGPASAAMPDLLRAADTTDPSDVYRGLNELVPWGIAVLGLKEFGFRIDSEGDVEFGWRRDQS